MGKYEYEGKLSLVQRLCYIFAGMSNFLIGYALYFLFKDTKAEEAKFLKIGAELELGGLFLFGAMNLLDFIIKLF